MDALTLLLIGLIYLAVAFYHREEKRKGEQGIPYFGPVFCDTFWVLIDAMPNGQQLTEWLDRKFKEHEEELRREARRKYEAQQSQSQSTTDFTPTSADDNQPGRKQSPNVRTAHEITPTKPADSPNNSSKRRRKRENSGRIRKHHHHRKHGSGRVADGGNRTPRKPKHSPRKKSDEDQ